MTDDNKSNVRKLRKASSILTKMFDDAKEGKYKGRKSGEAEEMIRQRLKEAAEAFPIINRAIDQYELLDNDPEYNDVSPSWAIHYLKAHYVNLDQDLIDRHVKQLLKIFIGYKNKKGKAEYEPVAFLYPFLALAKEYDRWAERFDSEINNQKHLIPIPRGMLKQKILILTKEDSNITLSMLVERVNGQLTSAGYRPTTYNTIKNAPVWRLHQKMKRPKEKK